MHQVFYGTTYVCSQRHQPLIYYKDRINCSFLAILKLIQLIFEMKFYLLRQTKFFAGQCLMEKKYW